MDNIWKDKNNIPQVIIGDFNIKTSPDYKTAFCNYIKNKYNHHQYVKEFPTKYQTKIDLFFLIIHIKEFQQLSVAGLITIRYTQ